tara:strand:+ start:228 stop:491 length:264 start_codon:yes stop_codon:yes gene_type:complete
MYDSYILYTREKCPFCIKALKRLDEEEKSYKAVPIDECPEDFVNNLKEAYEHNSFPMVLGYITASKTYGWVGGCDNLMTHLDNPKKF